MGTITRFLLLIAALLFVLFVSLVPPVLENAAFAQTRTNTATNKAQPEVDITNTQILPNENLKSYMARMNRHFAKEIERRGLDSLVKDEAGEYNSYRRFVNFWEPRLFAFDGDFEAYFKLEREYYQNRKRGAFSVRKRETDSKSTIRPSGSSTSNTLAQEIGPIAKPNGNVGSEGIGPIHFITFYNPSPSHMLCGSNAGGLFYSKNGGVTWSSTGTDTEIGPSGIGTAVFDPGDYKTWFAASAGNSKESLPSFIRYTGGVFRTTDEGVTWSRIADQAQLGGPRTQIFKLAINPTNAKQLWAVTSNGLFVTNNALSGSPVWTALPAFAGKYAYDFEIRPGNSNWLYVTVADWINNNLSNWRYMFSSNNGTTWQNVLGQIVPSTTVALAIEVSPAKADNLYCLTIHSGWYPTVLSIYDFAFNQWDQVYNTAYIQTGGGRAFAVHPTNKNEIFLSEGIRGRRYTYTGIPNIPTILVYPSGGGLYHDDIECLVHHPLNPGEVWMCNHGGVYKSINNGMTWFDQSTGLGVAQVNRMATAASDPSFVAIGLNHDGNIGTISSWTNLWSPTWKSYPGYCDGTQPLIDPTNPQNMWVSCLPGFWWRNTGNGWVGNSPPNSPPYIVDAAFNHLNPQTQFRLSTDQNGYHTIMRTTDGGNNWWQIANFRPMIPSSHDYFLWKMWTPEKNGDYLVVHLLTKPAGTLWPTDNYLYRTKIANATKPATVIASWEKLKVPVNAWLSTVVFDPVDPNIVYIANSSSSINSPNPTGAGMIFKLDYTNPKLHTQYVCSKKVCWDLTQNLPNATTGQDALALELGSNSGLYFATDFGLWYSNNATRALGNGWTQMTPNLPNVEYNGLEINYKNNRIRAASTGRGVWEADLQVGCVEPPLDLVLWVSLDEATGPTAANESAPLSSGVHLGGPTPLPAGKVAGALCFDGVDDHVDVPSYTDIDFSTTNFSLDTWVQRNPGSTDLEVLIDKRTDVGGQMRGYSLFLYFGQIGLQLADGTWANYLSQASVPADSSWHHVAVTVDRANAHGGLFYLDGQPAGPPFNPMAHQGSISTKKTPFRIGARSALSSSGSVSGVLNGCLDEIEAFKRVLNADEVLSIYRAGAYGKCK